MNISEFKNRLPGGGARANLFRINGVFPPAAVAASAAAGGGNPADLIQFMARAASIPAVELGTVPVMFQGRALNLAGDRTFGAWNITVINDTSYPLRRAFEAWSNAINAIESNVGQQFLSGYARTWQVTQLDRKGADGQRYKFIDCWPSSISPIELNFDIKENVEEFNVTLQYQYYEISTGIST